MQQLEIIVSHIESYQKQGNTLAMDKCQAICETNHKDNGGTLEAKNHLKFANKVVVAKLVQGGKIVGYTTLRDKLNKWAVSQVAVEPAYKRQGVAKAMYSYIEKELGIENPTIHVDNENLASVAFHESLGYHATDDADKPVFQKPNKKEREV